MRSSVCPALTTAAIVHGLSTDHDRRRGQRCTVLTHPVSLIHRGIFVQMNRATSEEENRRLKKMYLEEKLKVEIVSEALEKKW